MDNFVHPYPDTSTVKIRAPSRISIRGGVLRFYSTSCVRTLVIYGEQDKDHLHSPDSRSEVQEEEDSE